MMIPSGFPHRHLLGIEGLEPAEIRTVLDLGERFLEVAQRPIKKVPTLRGKTVVNLFLEPSTRTRTSFEIAAKRLSADAVNISGSASSTTKGETLLDTARNIDAMSPDVVVVRHAFAGAAAMLARHLRASVVNAGDGAHEHPTQALLDCSTIRAHKGRLEGLVVAICGDITHSRVARSNIHALRALGATGAGGRPAHAAPRGPRSDGRRVVRPARARAGGCRCGHDAADPEGAAAVRALPELAGVFASVRPERTAPGPGQARRHRAASGPHQPRRRDRPGGGRWSPRRHPRPGRPRGGDPDGGALPPGGRTGPGAGAAS